jgi:hypothetical protein
MSLKQVSVISLLTTKPGSHPKEQFNIAPSQSQNPPVGFSRVGQVQRYIGLEERASVTISIPLYICTIGSISSASRATSWNVTSNSCSNAFILRWTDFLHEMLIIAEPVLSLLSVCLWGLQYLSVLMNCKYFYNSRYYNLHLLSVLQTVMQKY